jgi:tRNA-binding EMAP/Myf-like protein
MATTKKRTRPTEKKTKKKTGKESAKVEKVNTHLSADHLRVIEITDRDIRISKLEMGNEEQASNNMLLSLRLLESKIEKQREVVASRAQRYEDAKKRYTVLKKEIWPQYGFGENEGLGFNPDTGEIVKQ